MRLFTKLRAEQIKLIQYPANALDVNERSRQVEPTKVIDPPAEPVIEQPVNKQPLNKPVQPDFEDDTPDNEVDAKTEMIVITTLHGDSHELPKSDLLLSPAIAERKDTAGKETGPLAGDWLVQDYDIETDKRINKVYDDKTFTRYFKAGLTG